MKTLQHTFLAVFVAGSTMMLANSANADLVNNGGFETGDFTGWSVAGGFLNVDPNKSGYGAHSGNYYLFFGPVGGDGTISQTVFDTAGAVYLLSYWVAGNGTGFSDLNALWNGNVISYISNPIPDQPYTQYTALVTGTGTDLLTFGLRNDPSFDALDDISLTPTAVPEPTTVVAGAMLLLPFGASALRLLRKKRMA